MWVDLVSPDPEMIEEATRVIRSGGIVFYPSDTIYGLGCDPFEREAVKRIFALKGRDEDKGVLLLIPDRTWVSRLAVDVPPVAEHLIRNFWPGTLTLLLRPQADLPAAVVGAHDRIGVRHPDSRFLQMWLDSLSGPVVSTSANISGREVTGEIESLRLLFQGEVDLFLDAGDLKVNVPSTVVDVGGVPRIVRGGDRAEEVEKALDSYIRGRQFDERS